MRNSTLLYGRGLLGIAFGSKSKLESLIESLTRISFRVFCVFRGFNIVKPIFYSVFAAPEYLCDIKKSVWSKLPWKYQGYHQEMEISGICNPYDYLM